jgi:hypothetical protein
MKQRQEVDIRGYSFDEFVSFVFDHETPADGTKSHPWYFDVEVVFDPRRVCDFYIRLFRSPNFLLGKYSKAQLDQGFWAIHGAAFDCSVQHLIWNAGVSFQSRCECVQSMSDLFRHLFATERLDTAVFMWWDSLCFEWQCGHRDRQRGGEDMLMQDVIFDVLADLLRTESEICQDAALHGLGHLRHPDTQELIQNYMSQHRSLTRERRDYALAAARFDVL